MPSECISNPRTPNSMLILLIEQPCSQCNRSINVCVCVCVNVRIANDFSYHSSFFELLFFCFRICIFARLLLFWDTHRQHPSCLFARSFAAGNRQLCLSLMMFRRDKGKYFQVMLECILFFGTSACNSVSHYLALGTWVHIYTHTYHIHICIYKSEGVFMD